MNAHGIADAECRYLGFELLFLDGVDDAVHGSSFFAGPGSPSPATVQGAQSPRMRPKRKSAVAASPFPFFDKSQDFQQAQGPELKSKGPVEATRARRQSAVA